MPERVRSVSVAGAIVVAEGVALVALSLAYAGLIVAGTPHNRALALFGAALGLLAGGGLVLAGRALRNSRRAAYSPILLAQIIAIPVGIGLVQGGRAPIAVAVLAPAVVVLALMIFTPGGRAIVSGP